MVKTCFLFGHRDAPGEILGALEKAIEEQYVNLGVRCFIVGHRGNFDRLAAAALRKAKANFGDICLQMLIAYHPAQRKIELPNGFDGAYYPENLEHVPPRYRIAAANRKALSAADAVICYAKYVGTASDLLKLAAIRKIPLSNLATA